MQLTDALHRAERLFGNKEGIICGEQRFSYAKFAVRCRRLATVLHHLQVGPGDRVAVLMPNCHRYLEAYCAIPGIGAVIVPLNNRHSIAEQRAILDDAQARLLIVDESLAAVAHALDSPSLATLTAPTQYEHLLAKSDETPLGEEVDEHDLAALFYTSGTTSTPKGVMLTHRNLVANAFHITIGFGYRESDVFLHVAPLLPPRRRRFRPRSDLAGCASCSSPCL